MTGYKGFHKGMICRGKQYQENTVYEESGADACCESGVMHFCETPLDVLNYYPLLDDNCEFNEFAEVEPLEEVLKDGDKRATKKLKIGAKLSIKDFIKAAVDIMIDITKPDKIKKGSGNLSDNGGDGAKIGSSGDGAQIGSSGDGAKIGSSGDGAQIGSSGYCAKIGSSGYYAQIGSSGYCAQIGSSGDGAQIGSSGDGAQIGSSGDGAQIGSSGDGAQIGSSGYYAQIGSSGNRAQINMTGTDSVGAAIGVKSIAKGALGNWIVLAEWVEQGDHYIPACVKAGKIDGETLKPDTWYKLEGGEFVEFEL